MSKVRKVKMKKPELLAPAGSYEKAKIAFLYHYHLEQEQIWKMKT